MADSFKHELPNGDICEHGYGAILREPIQRFMGMEKYTPPQTSPPPDIDNTDDDTPVQNQGNIGACTAFGSTACHEAEQKRLGMPVTKLCELDMYFRDRQVAGLNTNQDTGAYPDSPARAFQQYGCCPESDRPYNPGLYTQAPSAKMAQDEGQFKIRGWSELTGDVLTQMWDLVKQRKHFYLCFNVFPTFEQTGSDGKVPAVQQGEQQLGGHCIKGGSGWVNDPGAWGGLGYFKCKNSWDTNHGLGGYYLVPTQYFLSGVVDSVIVMDIGDPVNPPGPSDDKNAEIIGICDEVQRIITSAQGTGWSSPDVTSSLGAIKNYMDYVTADVESTPLSGSSQGVVKDICAEVQRLITVAQKSGWTSALVRSYLGSIKDYMAQIKALFQAPPHPTSKFHAPIDPGAIIGVNKWFHDIANSSLGCDMFCKRNSPVYACCDGVIEEVLGGQGISGGAEFILSAPDKSVAFRYRHCQAASGIRVGSQVKAGQQIGIVYDTSLDMLCAPPVQGFPDRWQHCDLSVAKGTDQFNPTGGSGGNYKAYQWLQDIGYQAGQVMQQTPGPTSCGMSPDAASFFIVSGELPEGYSAD